jgi:hypothetical protein
MRADFDAKPGPIGHWLALLLTSICAASCFPRDGQIFAVEKERFYLETGCGYLSKIKYSQGKLFAHIDVADLWDGKQYEVVEGVYFPVGCGLYKVNEIQKGKDPFGGLLFSSPGVVRIEGVPVDTFSCSAEGEESMLIEGARYILPSTTIDGSPVGLALRMEHEFAYVDVFEPADSGSAAASSSIRVDGDAGEVKINIRGANYAIYSPIKTNNGYATVAKIRRLEPIPPTQKPGAAPYASWRSTQNIPPLQMGNMCYGMNHQ